MSPWGCGNTNFMVTNYNGTKECGTPFCTTEQYKIHLWGIKNNQHLHKTYLDNKIFSSINNIRLVQNEITCFY